MLFEKYEIPMMNYLAAIRPTASQFDRIESALKSISEVMLAAYGDAEIYAQGSFSTDTLVKPLIGAQSSGKPGDYDVDIVVERVVWAGARAALESVENVLRDSGIYAEMKIDCDKNSCVRLHYAPDSSGAGFHVDMVPTKIENPGRYVANRAADTWRSSDAKRFTDWFNGEAESKPGLRDACVIIKRLRDSSNLTDSLRSIHILTLATAAYHDNGSIMGNLLAVLDGVIERLPEATEPPKIQNPVNPNENLADMLTNYPKVRAFLSEVKADIDEAIENDDTDSLQEVFGTEFKYEAEKTDQISPIYPAVAQSVQPTRSHGVLVDESKRRR